ncbi:MAG: hypothetical protein DMD77_25470 [Candidatus Rokuibacteriota bacterium]|nr:MAG: hypothetical protein DMD77_25470 [Candidatus Rokubacteria bacterium]
MPPASWGDVGEHAHAADVAPVAVEQRSDGEDDVDEGAVLAPPLGLEAGHRSSQAVVIEEALELIRAVVGDGGERPVDDLLFRPSKKRGRREIPVLDEPMGIERDDGEGRRVDEHPEAVARLPERLLRAPLLVEQASILQGDGSLIAKGLEQRHLVLEE